MKALENNYNLKFNPLKLWRPNGTTKSQKYDISLLQQASKAEQIHCRKNEKCMY